MDLNLLNLQKKKKRDQLMPGFNLTKTRVVLQSYGVNVTTIGGRRVKMRGGMYVLQQKKEGKE